MSNWVFKGFLEQWDTQSKIVSRAKYIDENDNNNPAYESLSYRIFK